jgi:uncharacterized protein YbjT (DUF2867 family)
MMHRMRIAVVGGTGTLGRAVVQALDGHDVLALGRSTSPRIDLRDGSGLDEALAGVDVVVDASNGPASGRAADVLVEGTRRLLAAGQRAGVRHHVGVSIVGCERVRNAYYDVKAEQERLVEAAPVPWSIVRSTQFHDLLAWGFGKTGRYGVLPAPRGVLQPVDLEAVARLVAQTATAEPLRARVEIAGPEVTPLADLARAFKRARRSHAVVVRVPFPGATGRGLREGRLTSPHAAHRGELTFAQWLAR